MGKTVALDVRLMPEFSDHEMDHYVTVVVLYAIVRPFWEGVESVWWGLEVTFSSGKTSSWEYGDYETAISLFEAMPVTAGASSYWFTEVMSAAVGAF